MQDERVIERRKYPRPWPRGRRSIGSLRGIEARKQRNKMNRVSECKDAQQQETVALGSLWRRNADDYSPTIYLIATQNGLIDLQSGATYWTKNEYVLKTGNLYTQVYCVTIERDPADE